MTVNSNRPKQADHPTADIAAAPARTRFAGFKAWAIRLGMLVLSPLLFCGLLEGALRLGGFGYRTSLLVPKEVRGEKLLVQNDRFAWRFLGRDMARQPFPIAIPAHKPAGTIRIFVMGESAAYGDPEPHFGLARMLEALLGERFPNTRFEVVNAAMTAINSHAILPIARSCAEGEGDIWVLYIGNNEVVGPFGAGTVFGPQTAGLGLIRASLAVKATRTGQLIDSLINSAQRTPMSSREWGGMRMFLDQQVRQTDPRMAAVYSHFEHNLRDIAAVAKRKGIAVIASTTAVNLRDCAPFASLHRPDLSATELEAWERQYKQGVAEQQAGRAAGALPFLEAAEQIDGTFAELQFRIAECCLALERQQDAAKHFALARDQDALRFRADSRINEIIRGTFSGREAEGFWFVDGEKALANRSTNSICGGEFLHEHVHLKFEGNYLLARAVVDEIVKALPEVVRRTSLRGGAWSSAEDCARRLAWSPYAQFRAGSSIVKRISEPPFTQQMNHAARFADAKREMIGLSEAGTPGALKRAEQTCADALAKHSQDWVLYREMALVRQKAGVYGKAAESWGKVVEYMPANVEGWQLLGECLVKDGRVAEGLAAFEVALKLDPGNASASCVIADILSQQGKRDEAAKAYEKILQQKPYWQPAHLGLGKLLESAGRKAEAEAHFRQALENRIRTPAALNALAKVCFEKGWVNEAATHFAEALELDPFDAVARVNLGLTLASLGRRAEARAQYAEAVRIDPNLAEARVRLGVDLGREGKDAEALEQFSAAVKARPDMLEARLNLGIAFLKQRRAPEALEQFRESLRLSPTNAIALKYARELESK